VVVLLLEDVQLPPILVLVLLLEDKGVRLT